MMAVVQAYSTIDSCSYSLCNTRQEGQGADPQLPEKSSTLSVAIVARLAEFEVQLVLRPAKERAAAPERAVAPESVSENIFRGAPAHTDKIAMIQACS